MIHDVCVFKGFKSLTWAHAFGRELWCHPWSKSILSLSSWFPPAIICTWVSDSAQTFLWQSGWVMEHRSWQTLGSVIKGMGGGQENPALHKHGAKSCPAIPVSSSQRTIEEQEKESACLSTGPCISQNVLFKPEKVFFSADRSLEIIFWDWTNVLCRDGVKVEEGGHLKTE